jgi:Family of unknown function (DUF6282)
MTVYDELLQDTIDLHCHVDLEFSETYLRKREPEWQWLPKAEKLGMRGVLLKSHWFPTAAVVPYIKQLYDGPTTLWSSVALNPIAGVPELWAAESAAAMGARVIFLPTWGSCHDLESGGGRIMEHLKHVYPTFDPARIRGAKFLDDSDKLTARGHELLELCHTKDLTLATGHVSWQEAMAFAQAAYARKFDRLIFTHPMLHTPIDALRQAAEWGAWIELCWTNIQPGRLDPVEAVARIQAVGLDNVVVSTDYFRPAQPSPPELFRYCLGTLYDAGLSHDDIRTVAAHNPARALGLE